MNPRGWWLKAWRALALAVLALLGLAFPAGTVLAEQGGSLDAPAGPGVVGGAMYTLMNLYNLINSGTTVTQRASFVEPGAGPTGGTGCSLTQLYNLAKERSRPEKTGQTTSYATGDDGASPKGVDWPAPRFTISNGTVTDNLTGLIWLRNANVAGTANWSTALS